MAFSPIPDDDDENPSLAESIRFQREIERIIIEDYPTMTVAQTVGILEIIKFNMIARLPNKS